MQEFSPFEHFYRFLRLWWILLAAALVGGSVGYFYSRNHPAVYEANTTFSVNIDLDKVPQKPLELHDEDLALSNTQAVLMSPEVTDCCAGRSSSIGISYGYHPITRKFFNRTSACFLAVTFQKYRSNLRPNSSELLGNSWLPGYVGLASLRKDSRVCGLRSPNIVR